ncbi:MAG: hypothetical protein KDC52_18135 [Ignavibacteriae bacterium]|nr:hypothetical protein [Ignavibacteriota bacterium]MCB0753396.1 hypothetical protein [Ignavibacteriota bacterium]
MENLNYCVPLIILFVFLMPLNVWTQKRIVKPSTNNIEIVDRFVKMSFEVYDSIFMCDSLTQANADFPKEQKLEILKKSKKRIDSLLKVYPVVFDAAANGNYSITNKSKTTLSLNKSERALRYSLSYIQSVLATIEVEE